MFSVTSACLLFLPRLISLFPWAPHHFTPSPLIYFFPFSSIHLSPSIPVTWPSRSQPLAPLAAVLTSVNPRCPSLCWESTRPPHHPASLLLLLLLPFAISLETVLREEVGASLVWQSSEGPRHPFPAISTQSFPWKKTKKQKTKQVSSITLLV